MPPKPCRSQELVDAIMEELKSGEAGVPAKFRKFTLIGDV
jgi:hypothetical protein